MYRILYFDGCNGWCLGDLISEADLKAKYPYWSSRNGDGLLECVEEATVLAVPV